MKPIIILSIICLLMITGCGPGERLQIVSDDKVAYSPMDKTCDTNQECVEYVNLMGGDGKPAKCINGQCGYPVPTVTPRGD